MLNQFLTYCTKLELKPSSTRLLIASSGGIDSMVLTELCLEAQFKVGIIHLNHSLRGDASDQDEKFIIDYCSSKSIPCYTKKLDIGKMCKLEKENMHQLARRERYLYFNEIKSKYQFDKILTAHHVDDKIEGFFLNLFRGSGLKGLSGIHLNYGDIVRPLLFATKDSIHYYARKHHIKYREDESNASTKYSRNYIRHQLIPIIKKIKPSYQTTINNSIDQLEDSLLLLNHFIEKEHSNFIQKKGTLVSIKLSVISKIPGNITLLYYLINPYQFTSSQVKSILNSLNNTGAQFYSSSHQAVINRGELLIKPKNTTSTQLYFLSKNESIELPGIGHISLEELKAPIPLHKNVAAVNSDLLSFPLTVRRWEAGDRFQPQGMGGKWKKVKKYLTDIKLSRFEKDQVYVVTSAGDIVWLIGLRVDERFIGEDFLIRLLIVDNG